MAVPYYYNQQVKKYIIQFMNIFSGMQVQVGKSDANPDGGMIPITIQYGHRDRVVAHIQSSNTQNKLLRLPAMSVYVTGIDLAPELRKGVGTQRRQTYLPRGEVFPDGITVVKQLMPIPYRLRVELGIYSSNLEQKYQIMEQILMLFDPTIQLQTSDGSFDWTKITTVELDAINFEDNYPSGTDRRLLISSCTFNFPIYISAPANIRDEFVRDIMVRIGVVSTMASTPEEIIAELDQQNLEYEKWFSLADIDIDNPGP